MKKLSAQKISTETERLIDKCLTAPDRGVTDLLRTLDDGPLGTFAARAIAENNDIAEREHMYACQDTGQAVLFVRMGDEVFCPGLYDALYSAVERAYKNARKSVADPLTRENTKNNCPPIIETELVAGDTLEISFLAKGAGSENMTKLYMLKPADGSDGIINAAVDAVEKGGRNACPPLIVGIGIGGVSETAARLSKLALLRPIGEHNKREDAARLETIILEKVNELGIGVAAFGGKTTALAVNIELAPTHIGMLPVAVNLQCHSSRHGRIVF